MEPPVSRAGARPLVSAPCEARRYPLARQIEGQSPDRAGGLNPWARQLQGRARAAWWRAIRPVRHGVAMPGRLCERRSRHTEKLYFFTSSATETFVSFLDGLLTDQRRVA